MNVTTEFPVYVGPSVRFETPDGFMISTGLGFMPKGYLDTINSVAVEAEWYDQLTADLISFALEDSVVWPTRVGWRPIHNRGLVVQGGYSLAALGGGISGVELVSAVTGQELPSDLGVGRTMNVGSTIHLVTAEVGWEWRVLDRARIRVGAGGSFTVAASTKMSPNWTPRPRLEPAIRSIEAAGERYLTDTLERYVHTFAVSLACGWQL